MINRVKLVSVLVILTLVSVFILQVYYGWRVYQQHRTTILKEMNNGLANAIKAANKQRVEKISKYFVADLSDSTHVKILPGMVEGVARIFVINPENGDKYVSTVNKKPEDSVSVKKLREQIINYNKSMLAEGSIMYWTPVIGKKLSAYNDTIYISPEFLYDQMKTELLANEIEGKFSFVLVKDSSKVAKAKRQNPKKHNLEKKNPDKHTLDIHSFESQTSGGLISDTLELNLKNHSKIAVQLIEPNLEILQRSTFVLVFTVAVLLLIVSSFILFNRLFRRQRQLSKMKDDFIDNVTHELLTPITTLGLALDTLNKDKSAEKLDKYLAVATQQSQRITGVVNYILQTSFVNEIQPGINQEAIELEKLLAEIVKYYQVTVEKTLTIIYRPTTNTLVWSDRQHLTNVFHNVIGNAIKYGPECQAMVEIVVEVTQAHSYVRVMDNGSGISLKERALIFEKFHRVNDTDTHEVKGLGIGLYYTRGILRQLRGDIQLIQSSTKGSTFEITLPMS